MICSIGYIHVNNTNKHKWWIYAVFIKFIAYSDMYPVYKASVLALIQDR